MTPAELGTLNGWVAVIAIASLVQALAVVGLFAGAFLFYRRMEARVEEIEREHIAPASARAQVVLDKVEGLVDRVRTVDDRVSHFMARAGDRVGLATTLLSRKLWPVLGIVQGVRAGIAVLGRRRSGTGAAR